MENKKTAVEAAIDKFYEAAKKPMDNEENVRAFFTAYDNALKGFLKEPVFIASHLEISDPKLQKEFEQTGQITETALKKAGATSIKAPIVLQNGEDKYLGAFMRPDEIMKNEEIGPHVNCLEVKFLSKAYDELVVGEDIKGIIINPYGTPLIIDNNHIIHVKHGCPANELEFEISENLKNIK